jgi:hypothetical protein
MKKSILILSLLFVAFLVKSQNDYLLIENFDHPEGSQIRDFGWTAHSAGETNPLEIVAPGLKLDSTNYIGNDIGNACGVNNTGSDENKPFSDFISEGSVYAAFLVKAGEEVTTDGAGFFFHFVTYSDVENPDFSSISRAFRARTFIAPGSNEEFFRLGLNFNSASVPTEVDDDLTNDLDISKTYMVVVKYTFVEGDDNDLVSLFVFEDGDEISEEPAAPTLGPYGGTAGDAIKLQGVALRQYNAAQNIIIDGIYVSTDWNFEGEDDDPVSINQVTESQIRIYPNPAQSSEITIEGISDINSVINITDISGKTVSQQKMNNNGTIALDGLNAGIYFIQITNGTQVHTQKIIIH